MSMVEDNGRILSDLHAAVNNRDLDKAISLFADDATLVVMPGGTCHSKDEIRKYMEKMMKTYEKFKLSDVRPPFVSANGEMATHEYMIEAKTKDGREGTASSVVVAEFRNGRITQMRQYIDKLEVAKQMAKGTLEKRIVASVANKVDPMVNP